VLGACLRTNIATCQLSCRRWRDRDCDREGGFRPCPAVTERGPIAIRALNAREMNARDHVDGRRPRTPSTSMTWSTCTSRNAAGHGQGSSMGAHSASSSMALFPSARRTLTVSSRPASIAESLPCKPVTPRCRQGMAVTPWFLCEAEVRFVDWRVQWPRAPAG
jgi:hypothetical protein